MNSEWGTIDYDKIRQEDLKQGGTPNNRYGDTGGKAVDYLKLPEGLANLRIVPVGNKEESKYFKKFRRHELPIVESSGQRSVFVLCWKHIAENKVGLANRLAAEQRLTEDDAKLYRRFGCPICKAQQAAIASQRIPKDTTNRMWPGEKYLWNVINRADNKLYIWTTSMTLGELINSQIDKFMRAGINPLDIRSGFDYEILATGNKLSRRYKNGMFMPIPTPLFPKESGLTEHNITPFDLTEVALRSFKSYQDTIDVLIETYGNVLNSFGYEVPGDANNWDAAAIKKPELSTSERDAIFPQTKAERQITREETQPISEFMDLQRRDADPDLVMKTEVHTDDIPF